MNMRHTICATALTLLLAVPMSASAAQYKSVSFTDLGTVEAVAINNNGMVAGHDGTFGFTWSNGVFNNFGYKYTDSSEVTDINDNGVVVGKETGSLQKNYTYHSATDTITFSNVDMRVTGINNAGKTVGYNNDLGVAYMVDTNDTATELAGIDRAYGINDSDQVVGMIWQQWGCHWYILDPGLGEYDQLFLGRRLRSQRPG